ncbi:MAG: P27 family phage terminase small subunit [Vicinamibacterales bacterium]
MIPAPPGELTLDELAVWNDVAPLAEREGTLTDATRLALRDLCEAIVLKRKLLRVISDEGLTVFSLQGNKAAHPLLTQFRGLMQRVEAGLMRFKLAPMGKEILKPAETPADPFAEFDEPASGGAGEAKPH